MGDAVPDILRSRGVDVSRAVQREPWGAIRRDRPGRSNGANRERPSRGGAGLHHVSHDARPDAPGPQANARTVERPRLLHDQPRRPGDARRDRCGRGLSGPIVSRRGTRWCRRPGGTDAEYAASWRRTRSGCRRAGVAGPGRDAQTRRINSRKPGQTEGPRGENRQGRSGVRVRVVTAGRGIRAGHHQRGREGRVRCRASGCDGRSRQPGAD